jgi:predicted metal-dependent phosphoesterase TrpH
MAAGQPFTTLCRSLVRPTATGRADLHVHTTHSDGDYSPAQVVDLARRSGLAALAITDHDTTDAVTEAQLAAASTNLEIIRGVEISAEFRGRELHLLGYFVDPANRALDAALARLRMNRAERFREMIERLRQLRVQVKEESLEQLGDHTSLGRRHIADLLVKNGQVSTMREAFARYLHDGGPVAVSKIRLPVVEAIDCVRAARGVASWAHPSYDCNVETLTELRAAGLAAIEVDYPAIHRRRSVELRRLAETLGLAVTAGSDCHGPGGVKRALGSYTLSREELEALRRLAAG